MENKYLCTVTIQDNRLYYLSDKLGYDINIIREDEDGMAPICSITSPHLNSLTNPEEIWSRAMSLIALYNGVANLDFNPNAEVSSISNQQLDELYIWKSEENITPKNKYDIVQSYPFDKTLQIDTQYLSKGSGNIFYLINLARNNEDLLNLLLQLGNGLNWVNLYSIYDSIKTYSLNISKKHFENVLKNCGRKSEEVHAFTGTANNYGLLGVHARHGELGFGIPKSTLTLKEAQYLILNICNSYIDLKFT